MHFMTKIISPTGRTYKSPEALHEDVVRLLTASAALRSQLRFKVPPGSPERETKVSALLDEMSRYGAEAKALRIAHMHHDFLTPSQVKGMEEDAAAMKVERSSLRRFLRF